ncbi:hypothetical protein EDC31_105155 [Acidomonas methanolica]|nr:hypothetical protein EDC31_105155 [Acidomonas methanolica]
MDAGPLSRTVLLYEVCEAARIVRVLRVWHMSQDR